jgi:hypothetical protein
MRLNAPPPRRRASSLPKRAHDKLEARHYVLELWRFNQIDQNGRPAGTHADLRVFGASTFLEKEAFDAEAGVLPYAQRMYRARIVNG